ncbi:MAG: hypothetical protein PHG40_03845 [Candidatus Omnitrophica bacterium]|nr:hypothetical protein [Candidatus Omnitrophota bacterium]
MDEFNKREIEYIISSFKCPKNFRCYKSGFKDICKVEDTGQELFVKCLEEDPRQCPFALRLGSYFCKCPLRIYIINKLKK